MKRKKIHFGSTSVTKKIEKPSVLTVEGYAGFCFMDVWDGEIKDDDDSPEIVIIALSGYGDEDDEKPKIFIHKKDCLQIATFLLNIHTEYANKINEIELKEYADSLRVSGQKPENDTEL